MAVKTELALTGELRVPSDLRNESLRAAGLAWLDMAVELFALEPFSRLELTWARDLQGESKMVITLDSSKNHTTKAIAGRTGAPKGDPGRRKILDAAVENLLTKTSSNDLWEALANQRLAAIGCWDMYLAWEASGKSGAASMYSGVAGGRYPEFMDGLEFLHYLTKAYKIPGHPWL